MTTGISPDFRYWNSVDPASFLAHDWQSLSREWATRQAVKAAKGGTLLEVGPGPGVDYERYFREAVQKRRVLSYTGVEGSETLCRSLMERFPEAKWLNNTIVDLGAGVADVVYARHVLEHQPAIMPALAKVLLAARKAAVITWYRPPGPVAFHEVWEGVHCHTFARGEVLDIVARAGFTITKSERFVSSLPDGDEGWILRRTE